MTTPEQFADDIGEDFNAAVLSVRVTADQILSNEYETTRDRSLMVMALDSYVHHVINLNDILCKLDGMSNPMDE